MHRAGMSCSELTFCGMLEGQEFDGRWFCVTRCPVLTGILTRPAAAVESSHELDTTGRIHYCLSL